MCLGSALDFLGFQLVVDAYLAGMANIHSMASKVHWNENHFASYPLVMEAVDHQEADQPECQPTHLYV